ncbi:putative divergent polysaccharide deacetylase [gamma proteobacterium IMCC2047]|nr:putative divergent polysaccharide deacetylase [gamma proteobacterium IMCC2047]
MFRLLLVISGLLFMLPSGLIQAASSSPQITIIIDDLGNNLRNGQRAIALPGAVTYSVLPFTPFGKQLAKQAHQQDKEVMLHMPMDNSHGHPLGPGGLTFKQDRPLFEQQLAAAITATPFVSGINNHMGSGLTTSSERMQWLMQSLKNYPLYFVDSRTSANSVAGRTALALKIPTLKRDIFLDHETTPAFIDKQFKRLLKKAHSKGHAVAIGHPYPSTLDYLEKALPQLDKLGVELVPPSQLLALKRTPQLVANKITTTPQANTAQPITEEIKRDTKALLVKNTPVSKPGQCRITEQLNVTRITCS